ncbi:MAG: ATP-binding protein [Halobacteriota archaeon]
MTDRVVLSWSGGKDAALALRELHRDETVEVVSLLTTVDETTGRSTMHGVRRALYERQAAALGLPIELVELPHRPTNATYDAIMARVIERLARRGVSAFAFGDLHLEDVRRYRERQLAESPVDGRWPLWGRDSRSVMTDLLKSGFRAVVVAVDGRFLDPSYLGRPIEAPLLGGLPVGVDPAGEGGEFHTFVTDGPIFDRPIPVGPGRTVSREVGPTTMHYVELRSPGCPLWRGQSRRVASPRARPRAGRSAGHPRTSRR